MKLSRVSFLRLSLSASMMLKGKEAEVEHVENHNN